MRTLVIRLVVALVATIGIVGAPAASAAPTVPGTCDYIKNTHCHCFDPRSYRDCLIID